ncbi:riboflavin kinase [Sulfolobus acidocaldarius SUSAZ]|nr:riboflavin kinase [Sulfolobus acidocaldarius SUSAZ]
MTCENILILNYTINKIIVQSEVAKSLGISQQTVSRKLKELEDSGIITRTLLKEGELIKLTDEGEKMLRECAESLVDLFAKNRIVKIKAKVTSGLGEGRIFVSLPYYMEAFNKFLGFQPYPGTLNAVIYDRISMENRLLLDLSRGILIPEHKEPNRVLGSVKAFPASINSVSPVAVVIPTRTTHPKSVVELLSPHKLREKLEIEDGDEIEIEVYL